MSNWQNQTIEALEDDYWAEPKYNSHLVTTCHTLRKKSLKDFETEDLRIMIGQNIGLPYLIPLAVGILENNILADGDIFEGDLLQAVLQSSPEFWQTEATLWKQVCDLFEQNRAVLETCDVKDNIKSNWFKAFKKFEKTN